MAARLIRSMLTRGIRVPNPGEMETAARKNLEALKIATVIEADNVASYMADRAAEEDVRGWSFPNLAPPFPLTWIEYGEWREGFVGGGARRWGVLAVAHDLTRTGKTDEEIRPIVTNWLRGLAAASDRRGSVARSLLQGCGVTTEARWIIEYLSAMQFATGCALFPVVGWRAVVGSHGQICLLDDGQEASLLYNFTEGLTNDLGEDPEEWAADLARGMQPALMAIAFMHCKNVKIVDHLPSRQERRSDERAGLPLIRYRTIEIDPMKEALRTEGRIGEVGLPRALHICRGHFAEYTEEKPLFGRQAGLFWRPQHIRGSAERGRIIKDYRLKEAQTKP